MDLPEEDLKHVDRVRQLRDELEIALMKAHRQRQSLEALRKQADALLEEMRKQLDHDADT